MIQKIVAILNRFAQSIFGRTNKTVSLWKSFGNVGDFISSFYEKTKAGISILLKNIIFPVQTTVLLSVE